MTQPLRESPKPSRNDKSNVCRKAGELGLTDQHRRKVLERKPTRRKTSSPEELLALQQQMARDRIAKNGHPRGALGMRHTPETLARIAESSRRSWADPNSRHRSEEKTQAASDAMVNFVANGGRRYGHSRGKSGWREDLGRYFRSSWEANYARYLDWLKANGIVVDWKYEPKTFVFEEIKRGTRSYTPDFQVFYRDGRVAWHEVKGWMDPKSAVRLSRMGKFFPEEPLVVIDETWMRRIAKEVSALIPTWERGDGKLTPKPPKPPRELSCQVCQASFYAVGGQRFCSVSCRGVEKRKRAAMRVELHHSVPRDEVAEGKATAERLGIDTKAWANEIREKCARAEAALLRDVEEALGP